MACYSLVSVNSCGRKLRMAKISFEEEKMTKASIVKLIEREWPEMTSEFTDIQKAQYELFCSKQYDYGTGNIAMGTMLDSDDDVQLALTGLIVRMNDKINRLVNMVVRKGKKPQNEPITDSFRDLSVYGIMAQIVANGKWGK